MQPRLTSHLAEGYRQLFQAFRSDPAIAREASLPFVPQVGPEYAASPHRILIVGKVASASWVEFDSDELYRMDDDDLMDYIQATWEPFFASPILSPFWRGCREISRRTGGDGLASLAWTNVFKVGGRGPPHTTSWNPNARVRRTQVSAGALSMLQRELAALEPDWVIFVTGPAFDQHLRKAFPNLNADAVSGTSIARMKGVGDARAIRSRHFQGMNRAELDALVETLVESRAHSDS